MKSIQAPRPVAMAAPKTETIKAEARADLTGIILLKSPPQAMRTKAARKSQTLWGRVKISPGSGTPLVSFKKVVERQMIKNTPCMAALN